MQRFAKKSSSSGSVKLSAELALPDWLNGKRLPSIAEVESYLACHPNRKPAIDKKILKILMEVVVENARTDGAQRAKINKTERELKNSSNQEAIYRAEIERLTREIEESKRYQIKLQKKMSPLEDRLRSVQFEDEDQDVMSSSERTIPVQGPGKALASNAKLEKRHKSQFETKLQTIDGRLQPELRQNPGAASTEQTTHTDVRAELYPERTGPNVQRETRHSQEYFL